MNKLIGLSVLAAIFAGAALLRAHPLAMLIFALAPAVVIVVGIIVFALIGEQ